jgi:hypothetical protein
MPQPVSYNPGTPVSGSIQENSISYVVDGQQRNYRGGFGGLSWMSEVPAENNVIFIGNSTSLGRGPANIPLFYPAYNNSSANIVYAVNTLPGSPRNFTTTGSAYNWAVTNNFFINNSNNPIPRIDADGLGLYIDANQPSSYPQTGTTWYDLSGVGNNSTLYNGPTWNSKGYIDFDGTDDFVGIGNTGVTKLNQNYQTLRFLIYITSVGPNGYSELYAVTNANRTGIKWETAGIGMDANGDFYNVFVNVSNAYSRWMDITCVIDRVSNIFKVYKNGTYIGQDTFTGYTANSTSITVGANNLTSNGGDYIKGSISEISVYGKELSLAEIKQNYFQSNIVQDGLVFMVDANNLVSYPKSGTAWYNLTGSVASATLTNGPTFNNINGGIINFDGVDDYAVTSNFPSLSNWSTEMWLNPNVYTTAQKVILDVNLGIRFEISNGFFNSHFGDGVGWIYTNLPSTTQIAPNTWFHVIVTVDASVNYQAKVYVNGVLENTTGTSPGTTPNVPLYIARFTGAGGYEFNGKIANTRIYSKALTASEVQQNYQATKDKFQGQQIVTNGLVLNLDAANKDSYPGTGTTWYDLSGNGYNGTLQNGIGFSPNLNGGVLSLDGADDNITTGITGIVPNSSSPYTVSVWCYRNRNNAGYEELLAQWTFANSGNSFFFGFDNSNVRFTDNWTPVTVSGAGAVGVWMNLVGVYTTTNAYIYLNGTLAATKGSGFTYTGVGPFLIGRQGELSSEYFSGNLGNTLVYNRALSTAEVLQNYNAQKTRFGL